jgi:methylmalonyl-CoA mutase C-terminal domain/subunit
MELRKSKILLAKIGLDTHETGLVVIARYLRDAGFEVVYLGPYNTIEGTIDAAEEEDVEIIVLSFHEGTHLIVCEDLMREIKRRGLDFKVVVGGAIPPKDRVALLELGVNAVVPTGTPLKEVLEIIKGLCNSARK